MMHPDEAKARVEQQQREAEGKHQEQINANAEAEAAIKNLLTPKIKEVRQINQMLGFMLDMAYKYKQEEITREELSDLIEAKLLKIIRLNQNEDI